MGEADRTEIYEERPSKTTMLNILDVSERHPDWVPDVLVPGDKWLREHTIEKKLTRLPVEKLNGPSWEELINDPEVALGAQLKVAKKVLEQLLVLKEEGLLLMDRNASNIHLEGHDDVFSTESLIIKHVDLASVVDTRTGKYRNVVLDDEPKDPQDRVRKAEGLVAAEVAESINVAAGLRKGDPLSAKVQEALSDWINPQGYTVATTREGHDLSGLLKIVQSL